MSRLSDLSGFYALLDLLRERLGGTRVLSDPNSLRGVPTRGIYFFFEPSEMRKDSGNGPRVVRVGTHALASGSKSTLRQRLAQHRGQSSGLGHHRGSIFRLLVGQALLASGGLPPCSSWGLKKDRACVELKMSRDAMAAHEAPVEQQVSKYIGSMPFLWLAIEDAPGPESLRATVEKNAIALLSNYGRPVIDGPSPKWLGNASNRALVRDSGLWNQRHVEEAHNPEFLIALEKGIEGMEMPR